MTCDGFSSAAESAVRSATPGAQDDIGDIRGAGRPVDSRTDRNVDVDVDVNEVSRPLRTLEKPVGCPVLPLRAPHWTSQFTRRFSMRFSEGVGLPTARCTTPAPQAMVKGCQSGVVAAKRKVALTCENTVLCCSASWAVLCSQRRSRRFESAHLHQRKCRPRPVSFLGPLDSDRAEWRRTACGATSGNEARGRGSYGLRRPRYP